MAGELTFSALRETVRAERARGRGNEEVPEPPGPGTIETHFVNVTSTTKTAGAYPCVRTQLDPTTNPQTFTVKEEAWIKTTHPDMLLGVGGSPPRHWAAKFVGVQSDGKEIYEALEFARGPLRGTLDEALSQGGNADFICSDSQTITVYDGLLITGDDDVADGTQGYAAWNDLESRYDLINASCPEE